MNNKLIRDKIPQLIQDKTRLSSVSDSKSIRTFTAAKVLEEAQEVSETLLRLNNNLSEVDNQLARTNLIEELADLSEIMFKVMKDNDITITEVSKAGEEKNLTKGSFNDNIILELSKE